MRGPGAPTGSASVMSTMSFSRSTAVANSRSFDATSASAAWWGGELGFVEGMVRGGPLHGRAVLGGGVSVTPIICNQMSAFGMGFL